ncbi:MAG TPA: non-homologous end-joining DNA ligase [Kofleriaceae bacterium]|nr:non-homologous end-joining DNA ligase [Kofleriaceae bacterium]
MEWTLEDVSVRLTNVERVMFPETGVTKLEVVEYYRDIAPMMLPELRDRALTIERFTKGIDAGGFFQKHWQKHYPSWLRSAELGTKTIVRYPIADTPAAIVYFANQGGIAMHIWTSRTSAPEHPDLLVFDLDPPDGRFDLVRFAALEIKELCESVELPTFVKTTGSKGLHVAVPLDGEADFGEVMGLGNRISQILCARHPDKLTQEFYKKERKGRLYLDIMRNALGATIIAPYSLRGRPGAPISAPIEWEEVEDPAMKPHGFTLRDMRARLDVVGNPWSNLRHRVASATAAAALLARV